MTEETKIQNTSGRWLALDTSTSAMTVAVLEGERLLGERNSRAERNHSMYLLPTIHELLAELQLRLADLDGFAVGRGPGSYTGVRIGITVAKTMAWALKQPVIGVSSLEAMALGAAESMAGTEREAQVREDSQPGPSWIVPLMDARRGQVYTALFASGSGRWSRIREDGIRLLEVWVEELAEAARNEPEKSRPRQIRFVGEVGAFADAIGRLAEQWSGESGAYPHDIHAYDVGRLALRLHAAGIHDDVHRLVPNYTQLAEAEAKLLAKTSSGGKRDGEKRP